MNEEDCGLCMFPGSRDNSNDFGSIVDQLSTVTSGRAGHKLLEVAKYFPKCLKKVLKSCSKKVKSYFL